MKILKVNYKMQRGKENRECTVELQIADKGYQELERLDQHSDVFAEIKAVLELLVSLQRFEKLCGWGYEINIDVEGNE